MVWPKQWTDFIVKEPCLSTTSLINIKQPSLAQTRPASLGVEDSPHWRCRAPRPSLWPSLYLLLVLPPFHIPLPGGGKIISFFCSIRKKQVRKKAKVQEPFPSGGLLGARGVTWSLIFRCWWLCSVDALKTDQASSYLKCKQPGFWNE